MFYINCTQEGEREKERKKERGKERGPADLLLGITPELLRLTEHSQQVE